MFVVEDGTGLENSNSYCTVEYFREYWNDRGKKFSTISDEDIQGWLIQATQYVDRNYRYIGKKINPNQSLQFPRIYSLGGLHSDVPKEILMAVCEAGNLVADGVKLFSVIDDLVTERTENVGPIKTTYKYQSPSSVGGKFFSSVYIYLRDYIFYSTNVVRRY